MTKTKTRDGLTPSQGEALRLLAHAEDLGARVVYSNANAVSLGAWSVFHRSADALLERNLARASRTYSDGKPAPGSLISLTTAGELLVKSWPEVIERRRVMALHPSASESSPEVEVVRGSAATVAGEGPPR